MFSEREDEIIKIIGRKGMTIEQIAKELFEGKVKRFDYTISVGNSIRRIIKKCDYHNLDWTLNKNRDDSKLIITKEKL